MARASAWFDDNDMSITLSGVQSSTMGSTSYHNNSTGVTAVVYGGSTSSTSNVVVSSVNMPYLTGTNGNYRYVAQSTSHTMIMKQHGTAIITLDDSGLDAKWNVDFVVQRR